MKGQEFSCVDCGTTSPPTDEGETITKQHGWRITRRMTPKGIVLEPRCPVCYAKHRASGPKS